MELSLPAWRRTADVIWIWQNGLLPRRRQAQHTKLLLKLRNLRDREHTCGRTRFRHTAVLQLVDLNLPKHTDMSSARLRAENLGGAQLLLARSLGLVLNLSKLT